MSKFMSEQERENYLNESKAPQLYGITFTLLGVTVIVVLLRSVLRNYLLSPCVLPQTNAGGLQAVLSLAYRQEDAELRLPYHGVNGKLYQSQSFWKHIWRW